MKFLIPTQPHLLWTCVCIYFDRTVVFYFMISIPILIFFYLQFFFHTINENAWYDIVISLYLI